MATILVEQAIYGNFDGGGYRFVARSPSFRDDWLAEAQRLCAGFGDRPPGVLCPKALLVQPLDRKHVVIIQVADQGTDDAGREGALGFHLLVIPRAAYRGWDGDPFTLAKRCPPDWQARGELPSLDWPAEPLPGRSLQQVQRVLKRPDGPNLLGGSQILVDGGRVVFQRREPDPDTLRDLWTLLPTSTRSELTLATFAFGNSLQFHALATPRTEGEEFTHYHNEGQAGEYPEGRYELALQTAVESSDQPALDRLLARRSQKETLRLAWYILAASVVVLLLVGLMRPSTIRRNPQAKWPESRQGSTERMAPDLPAADQFPSLSQEESRQLARRLAELAERIGIPAFQHWQVRQIASAIALSRSTTGLACALPPLANSDSTHVLFGPESVLEALDTHLGTPDSHRDPGPLQAQGPVQRQLRLLLWKHDLAAYNDPRLNPVELVERLSDALANKKAVQAGGRNE
jgi:hypothetical protein